MAPFVNGLPQIIAFIIPSERVNINGNWDVMGLRSTGSFDFEVPEQHVEACATFPIFQYKTITGGPPYGLCPITLRTISSVAWPLGVAKRALHEIAEIGRRWSRPAGLPTGRREADLPARLRPSRDRGLEPAAF